MKNNKLQPVLPPSGVPVRSFRSRICAIIDPVRSEAVNAVLICRSAVTVDVDIVRAERHIFERGRRIGRAA